MPLINVLQTFLTAVQFRFEHYFHDPLVSLSTVVIHHKGRVHLLFLFGWLHLRSGNGLSNQDPYSEPEEPNRRSLEAI